MPSQAMQESIDALRERQQASGGQAPPPQKELSAPPSSPGTAFIRCPTTCW